MLSITYIAVLLLALLSGLTTLIGVVLAIFFKKNIKIVTVGIGFSAGIMVIISFLELIPKAASATNWLYSLFAVGLGALLILILHLIIPHTHLIKEKGRKKLLVRAAYLIAFGLILHDFPEGFAMANSYIYSPALGLLVAIAIAVHNIPEEFAMAMPIILIKKRKTLFKAAFLSGLAEPAGAVLGLLAVAIAPALNAFFMAFAAGAMILVSFNELFPMARKYKKTHLFILGIILSLIVYFILHAFFPGA